MKGDSEQCFCLTKTLVRGAPPETPLVAAEWHEERSTGLPQRRQAEKIGPRKAYAAYRSPRPARTNSRLLKGAPLPSNRPLSDFIREQALTGAILVRAFRALSAIDRHDLARIGSNLNQIAPRVQHDRRYLSRTQH